MKIVILGINHKIAPIEIREKFYLNSTHQDLLLSELKCSPTIAEAFVLSTCNRTELYVHQIDHLTQLEAYVRLLCGIKKENFHSELLEYFYVYEDTVAIKHLFQVITGLDSLVIGEKQILGQVKAAFEKAREKSFLGAEFNLLAQAAIRAGKKAHTETNIGIGGSSVSWAAMTMAEKELGTLEGKSLLIIGAGKMSELTVSQVANKKLKNLYLMNRTHENAQKLAEQYTGIAVPFCDIKEAFAKVDACICAVDAPHYIIDETLIQKILPLREKPAFLLIDISMPRNIDPKAGLLPGVCLYHIDDLNQPIEENMRLRMDAVKDVEEIISKKIDDYAAKIKKIHQYTEQSKGIVTQR